MGKHIHVHLHVPGLAAIKRQLGVLNDLVLLQGVKIMADLSGLQSAITKLAADQSNETTEVRDVVRGLQSQVATLQATIDELVAGQVTQEQIDALTDQVTDVDESLQQISDAADPETPTPDDGGEPAPSDGGGEEPAPTDGSDGGTVVTPEEGADTGTGF